MLEFDPPVIAHRGASGDAPENTMAAFTRAAQLGMRWVEFDVMLAACGTPVIIHDETLDRTTNAVGGVGDYPYAYLQTLDAGSWYGAAFAGERIPSLQQLAEFLADTGLCANVEIKPLPGQDEQTVITALKVIADFIPLNSEKLLFSSFSLKALHLLRQHARDTQLGFLMHEWQADWQSHATELACVSVHVNQEILTKARAAEIKAANKLLLSYTVNDVALAETLFGYGVDAVFSDYPDHINPTYTQPNTM